MKKTLVLCTSILLFILLSFTVGAATYGDLTYSVSNNRITITDCNASEKML